ncbi:MAG: PKD domain-containing protein [Flavobacteriales bacterium]|nr:PKD domain-containing protein [Flavobacteriales bacterium]
MNSRFLTMLSILSIATIFNGCNQNTDELDADFSTPATTLSAGSDIDFKDESLGNPTAWEWVFNGGTPATSTSQNPEEIAYNTPGVYDVILTVTNGDGSNSETKTGYITVNSIGDGCGDDLTVTDIDGNTYPVVTIGGQCWMAENLRTTRYRNGVVIPLVTDSIEWITQITAAYCWYDNDNTNEATYGKLYNWFAVVDTSRICPNGWHVPSDFEMTVLTTFLGGTDIAGGQLKETGTSNWESPNAGATNSTGFSALPGGYRFSDGAFYYKGFNGLYWSSTKDGSLSWFRTLNNETPESYRAALFRRSGYSCRCVKD